jgi:hypothetical protein
MPSFKRRFARRLRQRARRQHRDLDGMKTLLAFTYKGEFDFCFPRELTCVPVPCLCIRKFSGFILLLHNSLSRAAGRDDVIPLETLQTTKTGRTADTHLYLCI